MCVGGGVLLDGRFWAFSLGLLGRFKVFGTGFICVVFLLVVCG